VSPRRLLRREERVASILAASARAFATGGFAGTSMEDIAAEAGVTKLIVYRHFATKQELYEAVLDHTRERLAEATRVRERTPAPDMIGALIAAARADPPALALLFRHAAREPQFTRYAAEFQQRAAAVAERGLAPAVPDPVLRRWLARLLFGLVIEGVLAWLEVAEPDPQGDQALAERLDRASTAVVAAVVAGSLPAEAAADGAPNLP
jgi:AcrR family transcriptional regulator